MDFLNDLGVLIGAVGILGILAAAVYALFEIKAMGRTAERYEDHLKAIRRDIRLVAMLTIRTREEAKEAEAGDEEIPTRRPLTEVGDEERPLRKPLADVLAESTEEIVLEEPEPRPSSTPRKPRDRIFQPDPGLPKLAPRSQCGANVQAPATPKLGPKASAKKKKKKKQKKAREARTFA